MFDETTNRVSIIRYINLIVNELYIKYLFDGCLMELRIESFIRELYFPYQIKAAGKDILKHLGDLRPITEGMDDAEKLGEIQSEFDHLYDPNHLETLDSVEEVRIIREALKK